MTFWKMPHLGLAYKLICCFTQKSRDVLIFYSIFQGVIYLLVSLQEPHPPNLRSAIIVLYSWVTNSYLGLLRTWLKVYSRKPKVFLCSKNRQTILYTSNWFNITNCFSYVCFCGPQAWFSWILLDVKKKKKSPATKGHEIFIL